MAHEYHESETVTISRYNYDEIKNGYDCKFEKMTEAVKEVIEENEKLKSAICVVEIYNRKVYEGHSETYKTVPEDVKVFNIKSDFYDQIYEFFLTQKNAQRQIENVNSSLASETLRITNFQNSIIGKILNFFGVMI